MGNRAILFVTDGPETDVPGTCIYLHWNGGPESVQAFVQFTAEHCRSGDYFTARLIQAIGNYLEGNLSLGVFAVADLGGIPSPGDNGIYHVDAEAKKIVSHAGEPFDADAARDHDYWRGDETIMKGIEAGNPDLACRNPV